MSDSSRPGDPNFSSDPNNDPNSAYGLNSKVMVAAIIVLFLVVLFILTLHIYAKWFWRHSPGLADRRQISWRRRRRFDFTGQEPYRVSENVGLEKSVIDSLPTFTYKVPLTEESVLECAVCLCEFQEDEKGRLLPKCNHSFHTECIDMWFHSHSTCPLCRTSAKQDPEHVITVAQQQEEDSSTENSSALLLPLSVSGFETSDRHGGSQRVDIPEGAANATQATQCMEDDPLRNEVSLPLPGEDRERSISHSLGVQYPTNVLFWGDHNHVSSRVSSPRLEHGQPGTRSLPHISIDIPRRADSLISPRCISSEEQACSSTSSQSLKSPVTRLRSLKRLLSRERKVFPSDQDVGERDQAGAVSST